MTKRAAAAARLPGHDFGLLETVGTSIAGRGQKRGAAWVCLLALVVSLASLPFVGQPIVPMPGFVAADQAGLVFAYALTMTLFYVQFAQSREVSVLVLGAGSLYTGGICLLQMLCFPNVAAPGLLMGQGADTLTWLWTFWHLGPPVFAIAFAVLEGRAAPVLARPRRVGFMIGGVTVGVLLAVGFCGALAISWVQALPRTVDGDNYWRVTTTGVGPAIEVLTLGGLGALFWTTRLRSVLQLWLAVSLFLLVLDNLITDLGAARGTLGWAGGRVLALLSAGSILLFCLLEQDQLRRRAMSIARERTAALAAAEAARGSLELALEGGGMGEWALDLATGASRRSLRHDQIFGHEALLPSWTVADFFDRVVPEDRPRVMALFQTGMEAGKLALECRIRRASDEQVRWIGVLGRIYCDADGRPASMAGCVQDTTDRHEAEERFRHSERMHSIGQLTGGVAHDFNNLLTVVIGSLEMIKRAPSSPERVLRLADAAMVAAQRGADVTSKLLAFSRRQVVRPEVVNPNRLLQEFGPLLRRVIDDRSELRFELDPAICPARVDPRQFEAALLNLVANARDALPSGGTITISTVNMVLDEAEAAGHEVPAGGYVQVRVRDDGFGMDADTVRLAFEPFFTTKDIGRGTGLGLSQVYGFARQAGGAARIESAVGRGTVVELLLPCSAGLECGQAAPAETRVPLGPAARGEVVLVVEDDPAVLTLAVECLHDLGYKTLSATSGRLALERLRSPERIDVLFSDIVMPGGMNGVQLSLAARTIREGLKVVLTSGYTAQALEHNHELPQGTPLLSKPYAPEELARTIHEILRAQPAQ